MILHLGAHIRLTRPALDARKRIVADRGSTGRIVARMTNGKSQTVSGYVVYLDSPHFRTVTVDIADVQEAKA